MNNLGMASTGRYHQRRLVVLVEGRAGLLVAGIEEDLADFVVAEGGGEVEIRVGQALEGLIWVVDESWVRLEDALDEEGVVGMDRTS